MDIEDIGVLRMAHQGISRPFFSKPEDVVRHMGAVQAQDYPGALWAIGLRMKSATQQSVESALNAGHIVRTWPMRGTLHFLHCDDVRWMLSLMTPPIIRSYAHRMRFHGLTPDIYVKAGKVIRAALKGGKSLTRPEIYTLFEGAKLPTKNSLGLHITGRLAHEQLICFGPRRGNQQTFVSFDEWVPTGKNLSGEKALAELVTRYFTSHGPAQIQDLSWWSGLPQRDIRAGIAAAGKRLHTQEINGMVYYYGGLAQSSSSSGQAYLLPPFDEFYVAYKNRSAILEADHAAHIDPAKNGLFKPIVVIDSQVLGTWRRTVEKKMLTITSTPFTKFSGSQKKAIDLAVQAYRKFIGE